MRVHLDDEWELCDRVARERHALKKNLPTQRKMRTDRSEYDYYFVGCLGEVVYGKLTDQKPDFTLYHGSGDIGVDFPGVDVKTTEEDREYLVEFIGKVSRPLYVLVLLNMELKYGYVKGWVTGREFTEKSYRLDLGWGERKVMRKDDLNQGMPPEEVRLEAKERFEKWMMRSKKY